MPTAIPVPDNWRPLFGDWDELRHGYHAGDKDETVRDCVRRLAAVAARPAGEPLLFWTLGALMLTPYVAFGEPGAGVEDEVVDALSAVARGGEDGRACAHDWHPYEADVDELLEHLPATLDVLAAPLEAALDDLLPEDLLPEGYLDELDDEEAEPAKLSGPELLARWQCPDTAPGFALAALDYLGATVR
ncbi:hypothetical protein [Streptomyces sp. NBC_01304]|uniref:hypothetical protein n=1 Tax=Streptomyces sp. NBC_01304 TaxID=2903818 RepID=UPI002E0F34E5|nr:hypothetical protein OG430_05455 [Streptomyces sp. NBC_01304]